MDGWTDGGTITEAVSLMWRLIVSLLFTGESCLYALRLFHFSVSRKHFHVIRSHMCACVILFFNCLTGMHRDSKLLAGFP
jgi:hypothetical protein